MTQEPQQQTNDKIVIVQSVLGWLSNITPAKAFTILLIALAGASVAIAVKIQDPKWRAANLFPNGVTREKIPGGCILQTFHFDDEPDAVLIYRYYARGEAIYNVGYEADFLKADGSAESACTALKSVVEKLDKK